MNPLADSCIFSPKSLILFSTLSVFFPKIYRLRYFYNWSALFPYFEIDKTQNYTGVFWLSSWKKHVSEQSKGDIVRQLDKLPTDIKYRTEDRLHVEFHRQKHTRLSRLELFFMLIGPGILVMIADNDAGGVITYAQTGSIFGIGFFIPFMVLMLPVAYFVQEMTVRLGAVTHRGHAELIWKRFGKFWGSFSLGDLVIANFLTLITEFIGITVGMSLFGVPRIISAVVFVSIVIVIQLFLRYYTWERISLFIAVFNLL